MKLIRNFFLVVVNLIGTLWVGASRKPEFYDKYSKTKTRIGYIFFVSLATLVTVGIIAWLYKRIY